MQRYRDLAAEVKRPDPKPRPGRPHQRTWGPAPPIASADRIDLTARNVAAVMLNPKRAGVDRNVDLRVTSDGPLTVNLTGCKRTVQVSG